MSRPDGDEAALLRVYDLLHASYAGTRWHWMPGETDGPFEIIAGAILVQHTAWANAERAIGHLRQAAALTPAAVLALSDERLVELVRVSGTPSVKARRLRAICETIEAAGGLARFIAQPHAAMRAALLATHGIGPETADAIALYATGHPVFEIDAYTKRTFRRLGIGPDADAYDAWQRWFERALARVASTDLYRRYHAYIDLHAKYVCRARPRCGACPLQGVCDYGSSTTQL